MCGLYTSRLRGFADYTPLVEYQEYHWNNISIVGRIFWQERQNFLKTPLIQTIKFINIDSIITYKLVVAELNFLFLYLLYYQSHVRFNHNISHDRHVVYG